jgi:uroporphyrinogen-III synthase
LSESLTHRVIAIAEARELDVFAALLERRGARVLRYPLVQIVDAPDPAPVIGFIETAVRGEIDDLVLLTGEGLRRLLSCAKQHRPQLRDGFLKALAGMRKITRGPKPARALRELGLDSNLAAGEPTTQGVIETLRPLDLRARRVGVQLYGADPNQALIDFLAQAGAQVQCVAPYRYADGASSSAVRELLSRMQAGEVDAIAFTSKAQVERLFRAAEIDDVRRALATTQVAAVGPVVHEALAMRGVAVAAVPEDNWFMKPLTTALGELLARTKESPD